MKKIAFVAFSAISILLVGCVSPDSQNDSLPESAQWSSVTKAIWSDFQKSPSMIDSCAIPLVFDRVNDPSTDWPSYCNDFGQTEIVQERVAELEQLLISLKLSVEEERMVHDQQIWIDAPSEVVELVYGRPIDKNVTINANGTHEQWVYRNGYIYLQDHHVTAIQY